MSLPPNQARFVEEYLVDLNATQAAIRAGYSAKTADRQGGRLLKNAGVQAAIAEAKAKRADRVEVKQDDVLRELLRIASTDIENAFTEDGYLRPLKDMPVEFRRAIASVEVIELPGKSGALLKKVKLWDKPKALELLGKHLALFVERHKHEGTLTLEQLVSASMGSKP